MASELRAELHSLRAERAAPSRFEDEDWPVERRSAPAARRRPTGSPRCRRRSPDASTVPRLALEGAFLLLVALLAGLADLSAEWIVLVMAVAWALVALAEWAAAAKRSRWRLDEVAPPVVVPGPDAADSTGPWDMPVVESTAIAHCRRRPRSRRRSWHETACRLRGARRRPEPAQLPQAPAGPAPAQATGRGRPADPWET